MPPTLALFIWLVLLLALLRFDPARNRDTSLPLWVPVIWMFIIGSRLPSQWLGYQTTTIAAQALEQGNPLDRTVWFVLILLAIGTLTSRSIKWVEFLTRNSMLVIFLLFALLSVTWSDFPMVAFKRWFRDLGGYLVILVVLSDPHPLKAVRAVLRRLSYLLVPLSIVLIKYFPGLAKGYDQWTGVAEYVGVATSKNMLGVICLVSGSFFFWDTVTRLADRKDGLTRRIILVNFAFIAMTLWLLHLAHSATSSVCLALGCLVILAAHSNWGKRYPGFLKAMVPASFFLYLVLALGLGMSGRLNEMVGRQANFTDRTLIWQTLLGMHTNPLVGTGYQSFWLGTRLQQVWQRVGHINEAHNGYLQVYLDLGLIGLFLLCGFLIACYRAVWKKLDPFTALGSLALAVWTILLFYNVTEAAFGDGLLWMILLTGGVTLTEQAHDQVLSAQALEENALKQSPIPSKWRLSSSDLPRWASAEISSHGNYSIQGNRSGKFAKKIRPSLRSRLSLNGFSQPFSGGVTRPGRDK